MTFLEFILLLIVAGLAGALAQAIAGTSRGGCLVSIALGFIGAILGSAIARWLALPEILVITIGDRRFPLIWSIVGAALFVAVLSLFTRRPPPPPPR